MIKIKWVMVLMTLVSMAAMLNGCGTIPHRNPLPEALGDTAEIPDIPRARFWGDETPRFFEAIMSMPHEQRKASFSGIMGREHHYLALSGGGANGAFGAGLLVGWTAAGTRPEFTMVTGISTGALMAPFAFLGPAYDDEIEEMYTKYSTKDLVIKHNILSALTGSSTASTKPLREMLARYIDEEVRAAIAAEYQKGRRLYVSTTNLDAKRPVIWNIGLIAISDRPDALDLIHKVILASASIPAVFPPVLIEVEADGRRYDEIHVDGGTASQVFLYPAALDWRQVERFLDVKGKPSAYVIRNSFLQADWETVKPSILPIAGISINSLIRTQGIGDMYRIYLDCQRDGIDYHLAYIPEVFEAQSKEDFDPVYMSKLFQLGYDMAKDGYPWSKAPPGF
ncbi:MAG: patatin-like phospholipase family protein [Desulfobacterales bacterium]